MFPLRIIALLRLAWLACFLAAAAYAALWYHLGTKQLQQLILIKPISGVILLAAAILIMPLTITLYKRHVRALVQSMDYLLCPRCAYDLRACDSFGPCPECGRPYARDLLPRDWSRAGFASEHLWRVLYRRR